MTRLQELEQQYSVSIKMMEVLLKEYEGKLKGEAYRKRHMQIIDKLEHINSQVLLYGTQGIIIKVMGSRNRIGKKNPNLRVIEKFELYLVNVSMEDVPRIIKSRYPNVIDFGISQITPGKLILK